MNNVAIHRIIWKESRELAVLLIACGAAFTLTMVGWAYTKSPEGAPFTWLGPLAHLVNMVNMWVNTLGILIGVSLFAGERERRTDQRLAQLPIPGRQLINTKIVWAGCLFTACIIFCYLIVSCAAALIGSEQLVLSLPPREWVEQILVPAECFFWGVLWSLICRRTLYALFLATGSVLGVTAMSSIFNTSPTFGGSITSWAIRVPVLMTIVAAIHVQSTHWLLGGTRIHTANTEASGAPSRLGTMFGVLFWQSFRQFRVLLIVSAAALAIAFILQSVVPTFSMWSLSLALVLSVVGGLFAFRFDCQDDRYRFFQQNVEHGRIWWLARMLPPSLIALVSVLVASGWFNPAMWQLMSDRAFPGSDDLFTVVRLPIHFYTALNMTVGKIGLLILSGLALGQYCSMLFRYPIVSFFACGCFAMVLWTWALLLATFNANFWIFLLPMPAIMLGTTWWMAPRWLADGSSVIDRTLPWATTTIVGIAIVVGLMFWRANEIPPIGIPAVQACAQVFHRHTTEPGQLSNDPEIKSAQLMYRAIAQINIPEKTEFHEPKVKDGIVEQHQTALALIHQAQAISPRRALYTDPTSNAKRFKASENLTTLLRFEFESHMRRGRLDEAYQSLIALFQFERENMAYHAGYAQLAQQWSQHPKQTPQRMRKALNDFLQHDQITRLTTIHTTLDFEERCDQIQNGIYTPFDNSVPSIFRRVYKFMPWELTRTRRLGRHLIAARREWNVRINALFADNQAHLGLSRGSNIWVYFEWFDQSPYFENIRTSAVVPWGTDQPNFAELRELQRIRYVLMRFALITFMLEKGEYPSHLHRLVPEYLPTLPCNIFDGGDFAYSGQGLDYGITWKLRSPSDWQSIKNRKLEIRNGELIRSGPFLLPWSSAGSQRLYPSQLITEDDSGRWQEDKREEMLCYNYPANHWFLHLESDYRLPPQRIKAAEK